MAAIHYLIWYAAAYVAQLITHTESSKLFCCSKNVKSCKENKYRYVVRTLDEATLAMRKQAPINIITAFIFNWNYMSVQKIKWPPTITSCKLFYPRTIPPRLMCW